MPGINRSSESLEVFSESSDNEENAHVTEQTPR
jgi:hypothetical protein